MRIFTYILTIIAILLIVYNLTEIDLSASFEGDNMTAIITILAGFCAIIILAIVRVSRKIEQIIKRKK